MIFNSVEFALFLPLVFLLYWLIPSDRLQWRNGWLLAASYVFYGWWDWRFLFLIFFSSILDYTLAIQIHRSKEKRLKRLLLLGSLVTNLGLLFYFKYCNFFLESFVDSFAFLGQPIDIDRIHIILPVGISFYTFQTLSYTIDVFRGQLKPTYNLLSFSTFVAFFPQLVAGPIERAVNLLPQFAIKKYFTYQQGSEGLRQILWGTFKKVVIADSCALYVNESYQSLGDQSGSTLLLTAILFSFQIYGDFSGYSDIAIGTARLFGFELKKNFAYPYFSRDIAEFWRRWHISLSTWFRDYLYIPLGGSRMGTYRNILNVFAIFLVSGFWHGARWNFVLWGGLNALLFLPLLLTGINRKNTGEVAGTKLLTILKNLISIGFTFLIVSLVWVFFRSNDVHEISIFFGKLFSNSLISAPRPFSKWSYIFLVGFILVEWLGRSKLYPLVELQQKVGQLGRYTIYSLLVFLILFFHKFHSDSEFIYFQF
ncbi:MAG: MBOAT family O-acyltransferase [Salibacteraceae bacterium]